jgi:hypothetical protein
VAGTFHVTDGFLKLHADTTALVFDFRSLSGTISTNITVRPGGLEGIRRQGTGDLTASRVVNAAGPDAIRQAGPSAEIIGVDTHILLEAVPAQPSKRPNGQTINRTSCHYAEVMTHRFQAAATAA